ncbi:MAG: MlaD family protein [Syntrophobacteraceae bacterium]|jgi:paraquat-inducible protein B
MSKQANTKLIGGFVLGAIVLTVAGILLFGSGKFFSHQKEFVLFFEDSVKGLNIGAAVDFRGVNVGTVKEIKVVVAKDDFSLLIPVVIEIDLDRITFESAESKLIQHVELGTYIQLLIDNGLKAQLSMQSLITGQLGIHLDFYPDRPIRLVGAEPSYMEIPTIESGLSALSKTLENLPLAEIADKFEKTLDAIEKLATSPDLKQSLISFHQTFDEAHVFLLNLDSRVEPLATSTELTLSEARKLFRNGAQLARNLDLSIPPLIASLEDTSKATGVTMKGANKAVEGFAGDNSPVRFELIKALNEFSAAARSFRVLTEYLENHPEALIKGKGK